MKIKVAEATLLQINWLVAKCEGYNVGVMTAQDVLRRQLDGETDPVKIEFIKNTFSDCKAVPCFVSEDGYKSEYSSKLANRGVAGKIQFSTDWAQGGPIIERESLWIRESAVASPAIADQVTPDEKWFAYASRRYERGDLGCYYGETYLIAAMRCYVASKLGGEVEVPEELCERNNAKA